MTDSRLESTITLCDASWIVHRAAHSLLSRQRQPPVGGILEQSPRGWPGQQGDWGKPNKEKNRITPQCLQCLPRMFLTHCDYLSDLTANTRGLWTQRAAGSFLVRRWKWRLGILPTWPSPQTVWLVYGKAAAGSWFQYFGHQSIRWWNSRNLLSFGANQD